MDRTDEDRAEDNYVITEATPRPVEGCKWVDPEDGTCGHPGAYSPECWLLPSGARSDCPVLA